MDNIKAKRTDIENIRNKTLDLADTQQRYIRQATAGNTRRAYQAAIRQYELYGGLLPATEDAIARYISARAASLNPRTLSLHLTALSNWHTFQKLTDPTGSSRIRKLMSGIYRQHGQPKRKAKALHPEHIEKMITICHQYQTLQSARNNALIQVAYFGAFRRSELVAMRLEHLHFDSKGMLILIPKSKTDQSGEGKIKALPHGTGKICPVTAMREWLTQSKIEDGFIFKSINRWGQLQEKPLKPNSINTILKSLAKQCGFDFVEFVSSHSLRRGFATSAANAGAEFVEIKRQGGWVSDATVREYIEESQLFDKNAADHLIRTAFRKPKDGVMED